jgi:DNA-binding MarR family transcriptional regulator
MNELLDLIREVHIAFEAGLQKLPSLRQLKLAPFHGRLLGIIGRNPGCSQQELAGWTNRDKAQIARTVKRLESRGMLIRSSHEADWRSQRLSLTADGIRAFNLLTKDRSTFGLTMLARLSVDDQRMMVVMLKKMRYSMSEDAVSIPDSKPQLEV